MQRKCNISYGSMVNIISLIRIISDGNLYIYIFDNDNLHINDN